MASCFIEWFVTLFQLHHLLILRSLKVFALKIDAWHSACTIPPPGGKSRFGNLKILS